MPPRLLTLLFCLALVPIVSCNKLTAPPPPVAAPAAATPPTALPPSCSVESTRTFELADGAEMRLWDLKASGLKRLTARLLIATDGKVQPATEIEYKWPKWSSTDPAATGQLVLLFQDGAAFGAKGKRLVQLALDLQNSPSNSKTTKRSQRLLEGDLQSRVTNATGTGSLARQEIVYSQLLQPSDAPLGSVTLSSDPESLAGASQDGRTVVAVELEWADAN